MEQRELKDQKVISSENKQSTVYISLEEAQLIKRYHQQIDERVEVLQQLVVVLQNDQAKQRDQLSHLAEGSTMQQHQLDAVERRTTKNTKGLQQTTKQIRNLADAVEELDDRTTLLEQQVETINDFIQIFASTSEEKRQQEQDTAFISQYEKLLYFYTELWGQLDEKLLGSKVLRSDDIQASEATTQTVVKYGAAAAKITVGFIPGAQGAGELIDLGKEVFNDAYGAKRTKRLQQPGHLYPGHVGLSNIAELLARRLTMTYAERIVALKNIKQITKLITALIEGLTKSVRQEVKQEEKSKSLTLPQLKLAAIVTKLQQQIIAVASDTKLTLIVPPDQPSTAMQAKEITVKAFLQQPNYQWPCSKDHQQHHYYTGGTRDQFFITVESNAWKKLKSTQFLDASTYEKSKRLSDRPKDIPEPYDQKDTKGHPLASLSYGKK